MKFRDLDAVILEELSDNGVELLIHLADVPFGLAFLSHIVDDLKEDLAEEQTSIHTRLEEDDNELNKQLRMLPSSDTCQPPYHFEHGYQEVPKWYWKIQ